MENKSETWFTVVNPHAGSGKTITEWTKAERLFIRKGLSYTCEMSGGQYNAYRIALNAAKEGYRRFIAVGGDGTVHDVLDGILGHITGSGSGETLSDFTLAVIPIGSGNDWVRGHGIPHDTETVVDMIAKGRFAGQDVVKVSLLKSAGSEEAMKSTYMINVGGVGFDARVCERVNRQKAEGASGKLLYIKSLIYNLMHYHPSPMKVECDGDTVFEGPCYSIAFGIGRYSGGGLRQVPEAVMDDGLLDVTIIPALPVFRIIREAYKLFNGRLLTIRELISRKVRKVKVTPLTEHAEIVEVDGEDLGALPVCLEVLPHQIRTLHNR